MRFIVKIRILKFLLCTIFYRAQEIHAALFALKNITFYSALNFLLKSELFLDWIEVRKKLNLNNWKIKIDSF